MTAEDELFQPVDVQHQQEVVDKLKALVGEQNEELVEDLVDNQTRHLWLHQEAAFHLGMAVGLRWLKAGATNAAARSVPSGGPEVRLKPDTNYDSPEP